MIPIRVITALAAGLAAAAAEPAPKRTAYFSTGDRLPGTVTGLDESKVRFLSSVLESPVDVDLKKLLELRGEAVAAEAAADHEAVVTLTNGNVLRGQLGALGDDTIVLDTWYAGPLELRRVMVDSLSVEDRGRAIYAGPGGPDGWVFPGGPAEPPPWRFTGGMMVAEHGGSVAREIDLPERVVISFDLAWREALKLQLLLFADGVDTDSPANSYTLDFDRLRVAMAKRSKAANHDHSSTFGRAGIGELGSKEKVRVELFADRKEGRFLLRVDGKAEEAWRDPNPGDANLGRGLHFVAEDGAPVRVSRIRINSWHGRLEEAVAEQPEEDPGELPPGYQLIRLGNGDVITGKVLRVERELLVIDTAHGEVRVPVSRMSSAMLHSEEDKEQPARYQTPKLMKGDVRAWFGDGGSVVFRLDGVEEQHFVGYNQAFGTARFRRDAFSRVEFNIHHDELEPLRPAASSW